MISVFLFKDIGELGLYIETFIAVGISAVFTLFAAISSLLFKFSFIQALWLKSLFIRLVLWISGILLLFLNNKELFFVGYFLLLFTIAHWPLRKTESIYNH